MDCRGLNTWHHVSGLRCCEETIFWAISPNIVIKVSPSAPPLQLPMFSNRRFNFHWVPLSLRSLPVLCSSWWTSTRTARTKIHGCVNHRILEEWLFKMHIATLRIKTFNVYLIKQDMDSLCKKKHCKLLYMFKNRFIFMGRWNKQLRLRFSQHQLFGPACILCLLASIWFVCKDPSRNMSKSGWSSLQPIWTRTSPQWSWPQFQSLSQIP